jgi:hypothetical protein
MPELLSRFAPEVIALLAGGGLWQIVLAFRKDRREDRSSEVDLVERLLTTTATQQKQIEDLFAKVLAGEDRNAAVLREVGGFRAVISTFARLTYPLVAWIDAGATPPPPLIAGELRELLAQFHAAEQQLPPPEIGPNGTLHPPRRPHPER